MDIPDSGNSSNFDPDFAGPAEWAAMYRACLLQAVPAKMPVKGQQWKMPALASWTEFQENLIPQATIDRWYSPGGEHASRQNMGVITGRCSGNVFVIDLDDQKGPQAEAWWQGLLELHNSRIDPETVEQRTGGGGRQKLFRAPPDWVAPTNKTSMHIDIRGQGGFAMLPPSRHESGQDYAWLPGRAPWEIPIADAPEWLLEALEALVEAFGGGTRSDGNSTKTISSVGTHDAFGNQIDGREEYMTKLVWAALLGYRQDNPIPPSNSDRDAVWADYERNTRSRLPEDGRSNTDRLEEEGRGPSLFANKWRRALKKWHGKVAEDAKNRHPKPDHEQPPALVIDPKTGQPRPLILTSAEFLEGFRPPDYLVDGMIQRSYLLSLTARTGHGKTAVAMLLGVCVARGVPFHGKQCEQGGVLFLAGENPDDIRARYLALAGAEGFDPRGIPFYFVDGVINIEKSLPRIREEAARIPNLSLVLVDTQAAFFMGDEGNSNEQQGAYARLFRYLVMLPGKPTVLVNCHPVKNATQDNLVPMGGSAFLNEVDANLTLWADDKTCVLAPHPDKWRGVALESMAFEMRTVDCDALKDTKGRSIPSVVAVPITESAAERKAQAAIEDGKTVLRLLNADKHASTATIAKRAGWLVPNGDPAKAKVQRVIKKLLGNKFVYKFDEQKYRLTKKGCKQIGVKYRESDDDDYGD